MLPKKIIYSPTLAIWKSKFNINFKDNLILECIKVINNKPDVKSDGYTYYINSNLNYEEYKESCVENKLDYLMHSAIDACIQIYNKEFNVIKTDVWINIVRAKNPSQKTYKLNGELLFHNHVELNLNNKLPPPLYTFVCYIQMPDNLKEMDGVLFMEDTDKKVYSILPEEGDIIIMKGDLPHVPNYALNSTKDRIVLAGSIGMDFSKLNKTLI